MTIRDNHGIHPMQFMQAGAVYAALLEETSELDLPAEFLDKVILRCEEELNKASKELSDDLLELAVEYRK